MPSDSERRQEVAEWNRLGRPSPVSNVGGRGCLWILLVIWALGVLIPMCANGTGIFGR